MDEKGTETIQSPVTQEATLEKINESLGKQSGKSGWEITVTFLSSVVIAGAGIWFTHIYNKRALEQTAVLKRAELAQTAAQYAQNALLKESEQKILQMQTLESFIPHLVGSEEEKRVALIAIEVLGNKAIATQLSDLLGKSKGVREAGSAFMASTLPTEQKELPQSVTASAVESAGTKSGWAYMGNFRAKEMRWETWYFDELSSSRKTSYEGLPLTVREETGSLNVREGLPTVFGRMRKAIDVLRPGSQVVIEEVQAWGSSGYIWAKVKYTPQ